MFVQGLFKPFHCLYVILILNILNTEESDLKISLLRIYLLNTDIMKQQFIIHVPLNTDFNSEIILP